MDQAMNLFIAQTGIAKNESAEWKKALEDIYKGNYGESFEDIANSMALASHDLIFNMKFCGSITKFC